jgi:ABC-2 type transport system permease protein
MSAMTHELKASFAFMERNFFLSRRYWGWEIAFLVYSAAGALSIAFIGKQSGDPRLLLTLMVGAIFWNYLSVVCSWIAETIQIERWVGSREYTFMAPVRRSTHLFGAVAYAMVYGLIHTFAIVVAMYVFFPEQVAIANPNVVTILAFMVLGSFSLVGVAMLAAILPLLFVERGMQMAFVLQSVLLLVSGVYYPISVLPGWMQVMSWFSPATYALNGVRAGLIDHAGLDALVGDVWPLLVMGALFIPFGLWAFGQAEKYAKRTGKLKRVG